MSTNKTISIIKNFSIVIIILLLTFYYTPDSKDYSDKIYDFNQFCDVTLLGKDIIPNVVSPSPLAGDDNYLDIDLTIYIISTDHIFDQNCFLKDAGMFNGKADGQRVLIYDTYQKTLVDITVIESRDDQYMYLTIAMLVDIEDNDKYWAVDKYFWLDKKQGLAELKNKQLVTAIRIFATPKIWETKLLHSYYDYLTSHNFSRILKKYRGIDI